MSTTLSEQQIVGLAFRDLAPQDARIFCLHNFGDPDIDNGAAQTFGELATIFKVSFSTITRSLRASKPIMQQAIRAEEARSLHVEVSRGMSEKEAPLSFKISLQFGSHSVERTDVVQKEVVLSCKVWERME